MLLEPEGLAHRIIDVVSDGQGQDIALIDVRGISTITDFFVIAGVASPLQFNALADRLERELKPEGHDLRARNGTKESGWVLLDFDDVIVHLFTPEMRDRYRLEELWGKESPVVHFTG